MGVVRTTYIIDEQGNIEKAMPKVKPDTNAAEILEYPDRRRESMIVIISPAKKMNVDTDNLPGKICPCFWKVRKNSAAECRTCPMTN